MNGKEVTLRRALELAVATEELGGQFYKDMAEKFVEDKAVADIFKQLAKDEANHEAQFKNLLKEVEGATEPKKDDEVSYLLRAAAMTEFFDKKSFEDMESVKAPADALIKALAFEKSTLFYYQTLKDVLGTSQQLDALIAAEKGHVTALARVIVSDAKFRGLADPW